MKRLLHHSKSFFMQFISVAIYYFHLYSNCMRIFKHLYTQVIIAIITGIALGVWFPSLAVALKPFGDAFIRLIKMMIAPIIFCTIVTGIAGMRNIKIAGRIGLKAIIYFEI